MKSESNEEEKKSNNLELKVSSTTNETIDLTEYKKPKATETVDLIKNEEQLTFEEVGKPSDNESPSLKEWVINFSKKNILEKKNGLMLLFEIIGIVCYIIGLTGCADTQTKCLLFLQSNAIFIIAALLLACTLSYFCCLILVCKNLIHYYHLIISTLIYIIIWYNNFGADIDDHGAYNFSAFVLMIIIYSIVYGIFYFFYSLIKKKRYILFFGIIGSIFILSLIYYFTKWRNSCKNWYLGLGGKSLINDPLTDSCYLDKPGVCTLDNLDGILDCSKIFFRNCKNHESGEMKLFKDFINPNRRNGNNFAYPSSLEYPLKEQLNVFTFNKDMMESVINLDMENEKKHHEVELHFDNKKRGHITISIEKNETLVKEREKIRKEKNIKYLYKNILFIYIDAISRNHFLRKMKKTTEFIEKVLYDSKNPKSDNEMVSFQFFKYHAFAPWTHITVVPMFYGETMINKNGTNIVKYFQDNGYITGMSEDYCCKELFDVVHSDYNDKREWVDWDHENVAMFCDPNYHNRYKPYPTWKGPYSFFRRCLYGKDSFEYAIEYAEKFWEAYLNEPKFFRLGFIDAHEGTLEVIKYVDAPLAEMLNSFNEKGWLKDTAIFFASDHGTNMVGLDEFISPDYQVEKFHASLFLMLPNSNENEMQKLFSNIENNSQRFITAFDIHDTLMYMLYYHSDKKAISYSEKGQTLFEEINGKTRYCEKYNDFPRGYCKCKKFEEL